MSETLSLIIIIMPCLVMTEPVNANCFQADIIALTVSATPDYAMLHGVCKITDTVS